jgi:mRNA-degrading endonuclease RelE of RelBE toxin-antitoxin system
MIFDRTHTFDKSFKNLPPDMRKIFFEKVTLMENDTTHRSLRIKKIRQAEGIYEASVNLHYRFTFQFIKGGILLRQIGKHDETLGTP